MRGILQTNCKENSPANQPKGEKLPFSIYVKVVRSGRVNCDAWPMYLPTQRFSVTCNSVRYMNEYNRSLNGDGEVDICLEVVELNMELSIIN